MVRESRAHVRRNADICDLNMVIVIWELAGACVGCLFAGACVGCLSGGACVGCLLERV
jgi:hypothetical protein